MKSYKNSSFVQAAVGALVFAALGAFQATAADSDKDSTGLKHNDATFIRQAAQGGLTEVQLAELAEKQAQHDQVKQLAQRIHADHSKANMELQQIAQKIGATVPAELDRKHRKTLDDFHSKSGAEFDKAYAEHMIRDHRKDIKEFEKAARDAASSDVKSFAERTLPTLREHLRLAQDAGRAVGLAGSLISSTGEDDSAVGRGTKGRSSSQKDSRPRPDEK